MTVPTFRARYRLDIGENFREPGELVPEAITWFRRESYEHTGRIIAAQVPMAELQAAVEQYCPELATQIYELSGVTDGVITEGPQSKPRRVRASVPAPEPAPEPAPKDAKSNDVIALKPPPEPASSE